MSLDNDIARRTAVHHAVDASLDDTRRFVDDCGLPSQRNMRRLLALQDAVGDLAAGLARGHSDLSREWMLIAALAQDAVEETLAEVARRPITPEDFTR